MATNPNGSAGAAPAGVGSSSEDHWTEGDPFDIWLRRGLQGMFNAVAAEPVPDDLLRLIREDRPEPEEFWGGPSYLHRGARIECGPGGQVCRILMERHPLNGLPFGPAAAVVWLIDLWLDEGRLPDETVGPWAGPRRTARDELSPCPANGTPAALGDRCTVHVVDDEEPVRRAVAMLLRSAGIPARTHPCGRTLLSALSAIEGSGAGCVLTDLWMPHLDGLELLRRLKERGYRRPVVVMAEDGDVPTAVRVMKAGAADFIEKPFRSEALLAAIGAALAAPEPRIVDAASEAAARIAMLSPREGEVLDRLTAGMPNKAIARELGLSPRTVEAHRARLMARLGVGSLAEAVRLVVQAKLGRHSREDSLRA